MLKSIPQISSPSGAALFPPPPSIFPRFLLSHKSISFLLSHISIFPKFLPCPPSSFPSPLSISRCVSSSIFDLQNPPNFSSSSSNFSCLHRRRFADPPPPSAQNLPNPPPSAQNLPNCAIWGQPTASPPSNGPKRAPASPASYLPKADNHQIVCSGRNAAYAPGSDDKIQMCAQNMPRQRTRGDHVPTHEDDIFSNMSASGARRKYDMGLSYYDAEVEYRRGRSLGEGRG